MIEKHLRISVKYANAKNVIEAFIGRFKPIEWVCCYENKNANPTDLSEEINPHIHCYLKYEKEPTSQKVSEFFKKQPIIKKNNVAGYYHRVQKETTEQNIVYTIKHQNFISSNIEKEILDNYIKKSEEIDEDKKLKPNDKLYNRYIEKFGIMLPSSKFDIFKFIDEVYVLEFNKSPPSYGHLICYCKFIIIKLYKELNNVGCYTSYKELLLSLYNIRKEDQDNIEWSKAEWENANRIWDNRKIKDCEYLDE